MTRFVVGAYPASIAHRSWDANAELEFFDLLASDSRISALELPWMGDIHPHDSAWLHQNFPANLQAVITSIPFVMSQIGKKPNYGLASSDESGRNDAVHDVAKIQKAIQVFNEISNRPVVSTVEIHTAPRANGSIDALVRSLDEISQCDWQNTKLVIEHCDAWVANQAPEKGFLTLEDEIEAIRQSGTDIGLLINWGRSAIELRNGDLVVNHIKLAKSHNLLHGLIFSGVSDAETDFGPAWIDAHLPFTEPRSLLTSDRLKNALQIAGPISLLGIKMGWPPGITGTVQQRFNSISDALSLIQTAQFDTRV